MSQAKQRQSNGPLNLSQILAAEARLTRLHRLFKTHFNVTEPSIILEPYLFLGNCISAHDTHRLSALKIRYVLNVASRDVEVCPYYSKDVRTLSIDLRDDDRENILRAFDQAFAFIDEARRNKSRVLVHCSHGQSRSPTIVIGYLMRTYNVSLEQCLTHVVKARPCVLPNDGFLKQLILYDRFLVERRRQRQEESAPKPANDSNSTDIPISITQTQRPTAETDTRSNIQSSASTDAINFIPIQVSTKANPPEQIEIVPMKKSPVETDKAPLKENNPRIDYNRRSNRSPSSKRRQTTLITTIIKPTPSDSSRSRSAHTPRVNIHHSSPSSTFQQWDPTTYYPHDYYYSSEGKPIRYITEIYDKTNNRFIPANC